MKSKNLKLIIGLISLIFLISVPCLAQQEDPEVSSGCSTFFTLYELLSAALVSSFSWLIIKVSQFISSSVKNKTLGGILIRFNETLGTLVKEAMQTTVAEIKNSKDPSSPGGIKITNSEALIIRNSVLKQFKDLWGEKGLKLLAKILGISESKTEDFIISKIEALVHDEKNVNPSNPL